MIKREKTPYEGLNSREERIAYVEGTIKRINKSFKRDRPRIEWGRDFYVCDSFADALMTSLNPQTKQELHPAYLKKVNPIQVPKEHQLPVKGVTSEVAYGDIIDTYKDIYDPSIGEINHAINAVQVGDSTEDIDDWIFIEPQGVHICPREENGEVRSSHAYAVITIHDQMGDVVPCREDQWFHGESLDRRVGSGRYKNSAGNRKTLEQFLQVPGRKPTRITGFDKTPLKILFAYNPAKHNKTKEQEFLERAEKIRIGKPIKEVEIRQERCYYGSDEIWGRNTWFNTTPEKITEITRKFLEYGIVSNDAVKHYAEHVADEKLKSALLEAEKTADMEWAKEELHSVILAA